MKTIIGLDQSLLRSGFCRLSIDDDGHHTRTVYTASPPGGVIGGARLLWFHKFLINELCKGCDVLLVEDPAVLAGGAVKALCGLYAIIEMCVAEWQVTRPELEFLHVNASTLKKLATGSGKGAKGNMVLSAERVWPGVLDPQDPAVEDHADACWLAEVGRMIAEGEEGSTATQREVIKTIKAANAPKVTKPRMVKKTKL